MEIESVYRRNYTMSHFKRIQDVPTKAYTVSHYTRQSISTYRLQDITLRKTLYLPTDYRSYIAQYRVYLTTDYSI